MQLNRTFKKEKNIFKFEEDKERWNLDKHDGVIRVAEFLVVLEWLELVALVWLLPEELDEDDDNAHVDPLHEEHERHGEANVHCQVQQRHDQWRLHHFPHHLNLRRYVEIHAVD